MIINNKLNIKHAYRATKEARNNNAICIIILLYERGNNIDKFSMDLKNNKKITNYVKYIIINNVFITLVSCSIEPAWDETSGELLPGVHVGDARHDFCLYRAVLQKFAVDYQVTALRQRFEPESSHGDHFNVGYGQVISRR